MKSKIARVQALLTEEKPNPDEALNILRPLAKEKKASWPVYHYLGFAYIKKNEYETALKWLHKAIHFGAAEPETYHSISFCHFRLEELEKAVEFEKQALEKKDDFFDGWVHLGSVYRAQAKLDEALECYKRADELEPESAGIACRIGKIYDDQGKPDKALELFNFTMKVDPSFYAAYVAKAEVLKKKGRYQEAEGCLYTVLEHKPRNLHAQVMLGEVYRAQGNYEKAVELHERLIKEYPDVGEIRVNYALCLHELGRFDESEQHFLKALEDYPDIYQSLSNYLMGVHYNPARTKQEIFDAHKLWDQHFAPQEQPERPKPTVTSRDKKLRIGFLSGGFRIHPVGWMITRGLEHLPKDQFEVYCYTTNNKYDHITKRINNAADKWKSVIGYNDEIISGIIREDEIDILVELSGHGADNRLRTVTLEPAPVIAKWVGGLFNTTGLESVDYLITDQYESPEGEEEFYTEKLVRMPDDYISFLPPQYAPDIETLPAKEKGYITFGCFNNPAKVNNNILERWSAIMSRVPNSRLFLKSKQYDTEALRKRIIQKMDECGISEERLIFEGQTRHDKHLNCYNRVDIALDPWPYSGGLTTCEALWMGVPVITKPGPTFAGRHSTTHLINAGFPEWVVNTWDEYIEETVALSKDTEKLAGLRSKMRDQVADSLLCDGRRLGAHLSAAFREMWKQRVKGYETGAEEWQDHIEVKALSEEEIREQTAASKTGLPETNNEDDEIIFDSSFIDEGRPSAEVIDSSYSENGIQVNEEEIPENGVQAGKDHMQAEKSPEKTETFKIETKDGVTICTPGDLSLLTPYVLLEQEEWFEPELDFVRDYIKPGMNVLDIGAGFGAYALPMAKLTGEEGAVYAFEPGSVARRHLEMGKLENRADNLEVIGRAVSDQTGKASFHIADTPELNKLDVNGNEKVSQTTLDAWWEFEGHPDIDFIKLDVNGNEAKVLSTAEKLLSETSPVILFSIGEGQQKLARATELLNEQGYGLYEYIPGPELLSQFSTEEEVDPYLMNLIAIKEDQVEEFKESGRIHNENFEPEEPEVGIWKKALRQLPWTKNKISGWEQQSLLPQNNDYLRALDYLCAAEEIDLDNDQNFMRDCSEKAVLMLGAAQILIQLYNSGSDNISVALTLARVLNALGKRGQAVEVINKLMETSNFGQQRKNIDLPFLPPLPEQDYAPINTDLDKWLMVRSIEAHILLKDVTTYLSGEKERKLLRVLEGNPENRLEIEKRSALANRKTNYGSKVKITGEDSSNTWFWNKVNSKNQEDAMPEGTSSKDMPSKVIKVKVSNNDSLNGDATYVHIPEKEVFRLRNIFNDHEYSLPEGLQIEDDGVIVDVGANIGAFALYAKQWNKNAAIYCFEPNPQVHPLLETNISNIDNIHRSFVALGNKDGELTLSQHPINTGQTTTSHRVNGAKTVKVKVKHAERALREEHIKKIDVLKIDTEGAEISILKGLKQFLPNTKVVMLEYHTEEDRREIDKLLNGFRLYAADIQKLWGIGTVKYINEKLLQDNRNEYV